MPKLKGFVTQAKFLRGQDTKELERRLGFRNGRLSGGWNLYFLDEMPSPKDFEYRGYTYMSGGVERGHDPNQSEGRTAENWLKEEDYDLSRIKKNTILETFTLSGPDRLAKVVSVNAPFGERDYPPGSGVPQWELFREMQFHLAAEVSGSGVYNGDYR